ncbi:hypothetical protein JCM16303_001745 [Sporobolomyces ruberrimus]
MPASIRSSRGAPTAPPSSYRSPPSPTLSATTTASQLDLGDEGPRVIITRADLRDSVQAYEQLLGSAKAYRNALIALSAASTGLAGALMECGRVKGAGESAEHLMAASGIHYMVANSGQVLSDTLYRSFEVPLMHAYDSYVHDIATRHAEYEALLSDKTAKIRQTEAENLRLGKKKARDLNYFRQALAKLTEQVAEVDVCKRSYYSEVLTSETEMWAQIDHKVSLLLRSTLDLSDRLASKATSDPVIESMLEEHPDPFDSYRLETDEARDVFTVLPPMNMGLGTGVGGGSQAVKKAVEADRETVRSGHERQASMDSNASPRREKKAMTVSEVLGFKEGDEKVGTSASTSRPIRKSTTQDTTDDEDQGHSEDSQFLAARPTTEASDPPTSTPNSIPVSPVDSPALTTPTHDPFTEESLTEESAPFVTRPEPSRTESTASASQRREREHGRRLSRVTEVEPVETDPMSGDWSTPTYERSLNSGMNGRDEYESGEDDNGWRG